MDAPPAAYAIDRACGEHDQPDIPHMSLESFLIALANPWPGQAFERYFGYLDGEPVGHLELGLPLMDNLDNVYVGLNVLPSARRHGVGRALLDLAVERARTLGRRHLQGSTVLRHPDGPAFARVVGAAPGLEETRSRLDVRTVDQARLDAMLADAWQHAGGYRLILWTGVPADEIIDDVAYLDSRFNADAPIGDLALEPEKVDAEKIREAEQRRVQTGRTTYHAGMLHGDRLVAWTTLVGLQAEPAHAWQSITLVDRAHRGHRLGILIKLANLAQIRQLQPGVEVIDTYNAGANEHMLRINVAMGFREVDASIEWQLTL
ncbi:GNAT family N-acetyltransferase [Paractinoplanes rishiriensis]|uniref:GNAT family N-acetyltransferase n=2 Tax=Paractinoplanes rishiriensis TaxID=1050105 RepID=A0A919MS74_9ACTN|nr:GNAT family N-acetyltransferase [Actinoplanes rishiriensis]